MLHRAAGRTGRTFYRQDPGPSGRPADIRRLADRKGGPTTGPPTICNAPKIWSGRHEAKIAKIKGNTNYTSKTSCNVEAAAENARQLLGFLIYHTGFFDEPYWVF